MKEILVSGLLLLSACSFKKDPLGNQKTKGHHELYSEPEKPDSPDENIKRIVIASTNDVEAQLSPQTIELSDGKIQTGGQDALSAYIKILRDEYKNVVLVDSGNILGAGPNFKGIRNFYSQNKYDALTFGLGDFSLKLPEKINSTTMLFQEFARKSSTPVVLSNLFDLKSGRLLEAKGLSPYILKEIDGVKVGIIGLVPDDIVSQTPGENRVGLIVEDMLQSTLRQARLLRSLGAELVVVLTHQSLSCGKDLADDFNLPVLKVNFEPTKPGMCDLSSSFGKYLERLPAMLVDVVIGGRSGEKVSNFINGTLILSGFKHGQGLSYAEFFIDSKTHKLIREKTKAHQPILICREFFKDTGDCYPEDKSINHTLRMPASFLGHEISLPEMPTSASVKRNFDFEQARLEFKANIIFQRHSTGISQLISAKISGKDLIRIMEEDFNNSETANWIPSPFNVSNNNLILKIDDQQIDPTKLYSVVSDLQSLQGHRKMRKVVFNSEPGPLVNFSWANFEVQDSITSKVAAPIR